MKICVKKFEAGWINYPPVAVLFMNRTIILFVELLWKQAAEAGNGILTVIWQNLKSRC